MYADEIEDAKQQTQMRCGLKILGSTPHISSNHPSWEDNALSRKP